MFDDIPDILTAKECQQLLKIGKNSMLRYLKTGEIATCAVAFNNENRVLTM